MSVASVLPAILHCSLSGLLVRSTAAVNFACDVIWQVWAAYSPVKNSPADAKAKAAGGNPSHSATSGELDIYKTNCRCVNSLQKVTM
jgi:UDP-sugar pyrophosphorylase